MRNTLYYGDNLAVLREHVATGSVDLCYLDPPFNSNRSYNVLFKEESGAASDAQIKAFDDTWHWPGAVDTYHELVTHTGGKVGEMVGALHSVLGGNQMMAYLVMMAARLVEMHRVLKPTGSLYLHCDPTASHYLKVVMDTIFGVENFRNEVVWYYYNKMHDSRKKMFARATDTLLFYVKDADADFTFHQLKEMREEPVRQLLRKKVAGRMVNAKDADGHVMYQTKDDRVIDNVWRLPMLQPASSEKLGYPTQKPLALLERIIRASSNPGDVVLDPFCGCGTAVIAAQKLDRRWLGIDITHLSTSLLKSRLLDSFGQQPKKDYDVVGEPTDLGGAKALAEQDKYQFQWWAVGMIGARAIGASAGSKEGKKGADGGLDGLIYFMDDNTGKPKRINVQVKGGHVQVGDIRDLIGTLERDKAVMGVYITLDRPSAPMITAAASAGFYESVGFGQKYPRLQIYTIEELLHGAQVKMPRGNVTFKRAQFEEQQGHQPGLGLDA